MAGRAKLNVLEHIDNYFAWSMDAKAHLLIEGLWDGSGKPVAAG
jgi:hypothetical protein